MYGFQVPRNHAQAVELDEENDNTKWRDTEVLELSQIDEYEKISRRNTSIAMVITSIT